MGVGAGLWEGIMIGSPEPQVTGGCGSQDTKLSRQCFLNVMECVHVCVCVCECARVWVWKVKVWAAFVQALGFFAHFSSRNPGSSRSWAVARRGGAAAAGFLLLLLFPPPGELKRGRAWVGRLGARAWWPLGAPGRAG